MWQVACDQDSHASGPEPWTAVSSPNPHPPPHPDCARGSRNQVSQVSADGAHGPPAANTPGAPFSHVTS